jgi:NAD(P)-dependent dehydrogenase (short-subunit alcohol dehydrogenase family)
VVEDDDWLWDIHFHGVVNGTRAFLPLLVAQDSGVIVNTSSVFGLLGMPYQSAYCAAKFAVRGFTDSLRQELRGTGVRAINVHPGGIDTNIVRNARILVGPDARLFDAVARLAPTRYYDVLSVVESRLRGRARTAAAGVR